MRKRMEISIKTYKHLFEEMLEHDFIEDCIHSASKGKTSRYVVKKVLENPEPTINKIIKEVKDKTWQPPFHNKVKLREGSHKKERQIEKPIFNNE